MAYTGNKIVTILGYFNYTQGVFTGTTKPNIPGDPNYIEPEYAPDECPVDESLSCPVIKVGSGSGGRLSFNFSLPDGVIGGEQVASMEVILRDGADAIVDTKVFTDFDPNYFQGVFTGLSLGETYSIDILYKDENGDVVHSCLNIYEQEASVENLTLQNSDSDLQISAVDALFTVTGTLPVTTGNTAAGYFTAGFSTGIEVTLSGTSGSTTTGLTLYKNGITIQSITGISGGGVHTFTPIAVLVTDLIRIRIKLEGGI
jgi:hypothetical protein